MTGVPAENCLPAWQNLRQESTLLQLLWLFVKFVRQVSGFLQLLRSFEKFVKQVSSFLQVLRL
jgi:hypothetical protein